MNLKNSLRVTLSIAWKDFQVILKDRGLLVVIIILPAGFSMLFGIISQRTASTGEGGITFPVVLVNQDQGAYGKQVESILNTIDVLKITHLDSLNEAEQQVRDSKVLAAILIPMNLTEKVNSYLPSEVQVLIDPTQKQFASLITGIMKEVISPVVVQGELTYGIRTILAESPVYQRADEQAKQGYEAQNLAVNMAQVQKMSTNPWVKVEMKTQQGKDLVIVPENVFALIVPGFTVYFAFFIVGTISAELLKEKREGSLRRLMAAPIPRWAIIAGKMLAFVLLVIVQVAVLFAGANLIFGMPLGKSLPGLLLVTIATGLAATGMGMLVAAFSRSDRQADSIGLLLGFVVGAIGGCFTFSSPVPLYKGGGSMEIISKLTPHAHALMGYDLLLNQSAGILEVLPQVLILLGYAFLFLLVATWRLNKIFEER